jgi:hypothetical protein
LYSTKSAAFDQGDLIMRLLNTTTLKLKDIYDDETPEYAILSHTWGKEEFLFSDIEDSNSQSKTGFLKIRGFCQLASKHGFE